MGMRPDYMTEDQRFAAQRPHVLVFDRRLFDRRPPPLEGEPARASGWSARVAVDGSSHAEEFLTVSAVD